VIREGILKENTRLVLNIILKPKLPESENALPIKVVLQLRAKSGFSETLSQWAYKNRPWNRVPILNDVV